jgi:hypothetical protein
MSTAMPSTMPKNLPESAGEMSPERFPDRFEYAANLARAGSYGAYRDAFWPPVASPSLYVLDLAPEAPQGAPGLAGALAVLGSAIESEWARSKAAPAQTVTPAQTGVPGPAGLPRFADPAAVAAALRAAGAQLASPASREAVALRARLIESGYDHDILRELGTLQDDVAVVAAWISTWYGKEIAGRPTAFACRCDPARQRAVDEALRGVGDARRYLAALHADLRVGELPSFAATRLFFMAGEGNLHPKHIAYFLPEDEGFTGGTDRRTYYFANTHRALLACMSAPLAARFLSVGTSFDPADDRFALIPTLGVLSHELGHFVHRPATTFGPLHDANRWASAVLQEIAADVFGALVLADVWAARLGLSPADVLTYYLAECLRYTSRGVGLFPDSDGMYLQLAYYTRVGALELTDGPEGPRLAGDPAAVLAGLRSLGRVLADALLGGEAEPALALYRAYGPERPEPLAPLIDELRRRPAISVDYAQDHIHPAAAADQPREGDKA